MLQSTRMHEDESIRSLVQRIIEIITRIRNTGGTMIVNEIVQKTVRSLILAMIQRLLLSRKRSPLILGFNWETLVGKLQAFETSRLEDA